MRVFLPGGRTVMVDAGRVSLDEATGTTLSSNGPHHIDDYFGGDSDALDAVCDALT